MKKTFFLLIMIFLTFFPWIVFADDPRLVIDTGGHKALIRDIIFTSDGRYLVSAGEDKVVRVWDVNTGKTVRTIRGQIGDGPDGMIYAAVLSPNDRYLALGGWLAGDFEGRKGIRIHDFQSGEVIGLLEGHEYLVRALTFSRDSRYLASGSDETLRIWDLERMKEFRSFEGHTYHISSVAFSNDGERVVSGSFDHTLMLWDVRKGLIKVMKGHEGRVWSVVFSPDGRYIASGSDDKTIRLWDARSGDFIKVLGMQETSVSSLSFSPDSRWILTGSGKGDKHFSNIFSIPSGETITSFERHGNIVLATAISPDGKVVATGGGNNHEIYLWNPQTGEVNNHLIGKGYPVWSVGIARDGRSIAFGNELNNKSDNNLGPLQKIILLSQDFDNVAHGGEVRNESDYFRARERYDNYMLKTKEGEYGFNQILQVIENGKVLSEIYRDSATGYRHLSYTFTDNGRHIISGGANGILTLYNREKGGKLHEFVGHTGDVVSVAVSSDNRTLVSGSSDQTVKLWDIISGKNLLTIFVASDDEWVAWAPQGYYTSSLNGDKFIGWHLNRGEDQAAQYYSAAQFQKQFYRPDVVAEYLKTQDIKMAVKKANEKRTKENLWEPVTDMRTILPPMIYVDVPEMEETIVTEETFRVKAVALSNTLPITDLKVFFNGIQVAGRPEGKPKSNPYKREVDLEVSLEEGENILSIIAYTEKSRSEPEVRKIIYKPSPHIKEREIKKPDLILLAIGISEYHEKDLGLDFAHTDATDVEKIFKDQEGKLFGKVKTKLLINERASRDEIIKELSWLSKEGTQKDFRLLFLSGHGDLSRENDYYFFSHNHNPKDELETHDIKWFFMLSKLTAVPGKAILMVDTCRAAAVRGGDKRRSIVNFTRLLKETSYEFTGLVTFAASKEMEVSYEKKEWGHGAFTKALLEGLEGKADQSKDGIVETHELGIWINRSVRELTGEEQNPIFNLPPDSIFPLRVLK